jgi:hypothetical protein
VAWESVTAVIGSSIHHRMGHPTPVGQSAAPAPKTEIACATAVRRTAGGEMCVALWWV